jgi:hypothetical protein
MNCINKYKKVVTFTKCITFVVLFNFILYLMIMTTFSRIIVTDTAKAKLVSKFSIIPKIVDEATQTKAVEGTSTKLGVMFKKLGTSLILF